MSFGIITFRCIAIDYLVAKNCENEKIILESMSTYALNFQNRYYIWPHCETIREYCQVVILAQVNHFSKTSPGDHLRF